MCGVAEDKHHVSGADRVLGAANHALAHHAAIVPVRAGNEPIDSGLGGSVGHNTEVLIGLVVFPGTGGAALTPVSTFGAVEDDSVDSRRDAGRTCNARRRTIRRFVPWSSRENLAGHRPRGLRRIWPLNGKFPKRDIFKASGPGMI